MSGGQPRLGALGWAMRALHALMALLFVASAAVQYNDPDPLVWMVLYGAGALSALSAAAGRASPWVALLAVGALGWAAMLTPELATIDTTRVFDNEVAREFGGLVIVGIWAAVIAVEAVWRRRAAAATNLNPP